MFSAIHPVMLCWSLQILKKTPNDQTTNERLRHCGVSTGLFIAREALLYDLLALCSALVTNRPPTPSPYVSCFPGSDTEQPSLSEGAGPGTGLCLQLLGVCSSQQGGYDCVSLLLFSPAVQPALALLSLLSALKTLMFFQNVVLC